MTAMANTALRCLKLSPSFRSQTTIPALYSTQPRGPATPPCDPTLSPSSDPTLSGVKWIFPSHPRRDWIGPPDKESNLRPIRFHVPETETSMERRYREARMEVQQWNQEFWEKHNNDFYKSKTSYIESRQRTGPSNTPLSDEDMAVFYRDFLNKNHSAHVQYNMDWYRKNMRLLALAAGVGIDRMWKSAVRRKKALWK